LLLLAALLATAGINALLFLPEDQSSLPKLDF